jgi:hypothetical protein
MCGNEPTVAKIPRMMFITHTSGNLTATGEAGDGGATVNMYAQPTLVTPAITP